MNTNTIQVITATVASALVVGLGGMEVTGNILSGTAVGLSYLAVAGLVALAASDYRSGRKPYFATPVVTGHFPRTVPASIAPRAPSAKTRLAA